MSPYLGHLGPYCRDLLKLSHFFPYHVLAALQGWRGRRWFHPFVAAGHGNLDAGTVFGKEIYKFSPWDSVFFWGEGNHPNFWVLIFAWKKWGMQLLRMDRLMLCFAGNGFSVPRSSASHGPQVPQDVGSHGCLHEDKPIIGVELAGRRCHGSFFHIREPCGAWQPVAVDKAPGFLGCQDRDWGASKPWGIAKRNTEELLKWRYL